MDESRLTNPSGKPRRRELLVFILPNLFTTGNLFAGYFSIVAAIRGDWAASAFAIFTATLLDGIDGRVARLTKTQSAFGEQYDSMSDLVSFGAAPAFLMFQWALAPFGRLGWLASFFYLTCAALRLARFNVLKQHTEKRYFQGCPSPIAAFAAASAVLFYQDMGFSAWKSEFMLAVMFTLALTMISTIRYRSFKDAKFPSQIGFGYLLLIIGVMILVSTRIERVLFPIVCFYVELGPVAEMSRFLRRHLKWWPGQRPQLMYDMPKNRQY